MAGEWRQRYSGCDGGSDGGCGGDSVVVVVVEATQIWKLCEVDQLCGVSVLCCEEWRAQREGNEGKKKKRSV